MSNKKKTLDDRFSSLIICDTVFGVDDDFPDDFDAADCVFYREKDFDNDMINSDEFADGRIVAVYELKGAMIVRNQEARLVRPEEYGKEKNKE